MLQEMASKAPDRIATGLTSQVLYIRLAKALRQTFGSATIAFGMGDESFRRMLESRATFERMGIGWTGDDELGLEELRAGSLVFARGAATPEARPVPPVLGRLSSTQVRARVRQLREQGIGCELWPGELSGWVAPEIARHVARFGLY